MDRGGDTYYKIHNPTEVVISYSITLMILMSLNRGSNRSAHVLLNVLNKLGQRDKM